MKNWLQLSSSLLLRAGALLLLSATACQPAAALPTALVVTRVASLETPIPSPTVTLTPTTTPTVTPSVTPSPTPLPTATATPPPVVNFMAVGDVMLGRTVGLRVAENGPGLPFAGVASTLASADVVAANLECVVSNQGDPENKAYTFRTPLEAIGALQLGSIDVVSVANNHAGDYGSAGLLDMLRRLTEAGIGSVGGGVNAAAAQAPYIITRNGLRMAFLAYVSVLVETTSGFDTRSWEAGPNAPGIAWADPAVMAVEIAAAKQQAEVVIVLLHFGYEGRTQVFPEHQALARAAVDAGASLVLGAHPHVLQGTEQYGNGLIVYSLGNFVFDGFAPPATSSAIFAATLTPTGVQEYSFIPVMIEDGLPRLATAEEAVTILPMLAPIP